LHPNAKMIKMKSYIVISDCCLVQYLRHILKDGAYRKALLQQEP
jgi:hypothetical protein